METLDYSYTLKSGEHQGFVAFTTEKKAPLILVIHDWSGCNQFAKQKAIDLSNLGYHAFAVDLYGQGKVGQTDAEKMSLISPFMENRNLLKTALLETLQTAYQIPNIDISSVGVIGFCFGGLCALDLARTSTDINAVVSFHALLNPTNIQETLPIKSKILIQHGYDDPMVSKQTLIDFCDEMTERQAQWQMMVYGNTQHAFMNPQANNIEAGLIYNQSVAESAWQQMQHFFNQNL
jgi:dienelactone hydrolase